MINPVAQQAYVPQTSSAKTAPRTPPPPPQAQQKQQEDQVHLSSQALAAAKDLDHDGDSH